jgi:hypothetical protein
MTYFTGMEKSILQKTSNIQSNFEQKSNAGDITIPNFKLYYRTITIKTA